MTKDVPEFCVAPFTRSLAYGTTRNPWNTGMSCGGSSGGSGVALAAGMATLASASDIAGSARIPAAYNGVVGLKASYGRIPESTYEFAMNTFGGAAALLARVPAVSTIHGRNWVAGAARRGLAYRSLRRLGIPIVAVSEDLAGYLALGLGLPRARLEMIHNGIPLPAERRAADYLAG